MSSRESTGLWLGVLGVAVSLWCIQWWTILFTATVAGVPVPRVTLMMVIGLWVTSTPTHLTGIPVTDAVHWMVVGTLSAVVIVILGTLLTMVFKYQANPQRLSGLARKGDVVRWAGPRQLVKRGVALRPGCVSPRAEDLGFLIGTFLGIQIWCSVEDATIIIGPSRSGKGWTFVIRWIVSVPGALVTTSTRADNLVATLTEREKVGPVWIFDPGLLAPELGRQLRWDPVAGCEDANVAVRRAKAMGQNQFGSTENGGHWQQAGETVLTGLLHAAALAGSDINQVWMWLQDWRRADTAVLQIREAGGDLHLAQALDGILNADPQSRDNQWSSGASVVSYLRSPQVRSWLTVDATTRFDIPAFIRAKGTLYLLGNPASTQGYEKVIEALFEEVRTVADQMASHSPGGRLNPPLTMIFDEAANFHITKLPFLISAGGGSGITVVAVFQSKSQLDAGYERGEGETMWDSAALKIVLPGGMNDKDLKGLETLIGTIDRQRRSYSDNGKLWQTSTTDSLEEKPILPAAKIRTLKRGTALVFHRQLAPVIASTIPWTTLPQAGEMKRAQKALEKIIESGPYPGA